jgi:2-keto-3-deoxy-L-rhamnonate aldolase RhmA
MQHGQEAMMKPNAIKQDVLAGKTVAGAMVFEFFSPGMATILANAGCRFVLYDMEHTGLGFETLKWLFASCRGLPIEPMVRVPRGEYTWLARALDLGARGVMIPMVESAEHAKAIVQACRYPPHGRRGAAFGFAQCDYQGGDVGRKIGAYNERTLIIAQIETERGLEHVEEIAAVDGIDVLWVGHFDLSNFMGIPAQFNDPRFDAAMRKVAQVARANGKAAAFMATDAAWIARVREMGYTMIAGGTDMGLLELAVKSLVGHIEAGAR